MAVITFTFKGATSLFTLSPIITQAPPVGLPLQVTTVNPSLAVSMRLPDPMDMVPCLDFPTLTHISTPPSIQHPQRSISTLHWYLWERHPDVQMAIR